MEVFMGEIEKLMFHRLDATTMQPLTIPTLLFLFLLLPVIFPRYLLGSHWVRARVGR